MIGAKIGFWRAVRSPRPSEWIGVEKMDGSNGEARHVARNEALFRSVNEKIESLNERFGVASERAEFVCECADELCTERVTLTLGEYEGVRRVPTHFVVIHGHVNHQFEKVVGSVDGYVVVEKFGEAGKESVKLDDRQRLTDVHVRKS
jgi:hypothetical protein